MIDATIMECFPSKQKISIEAYKSLLGAIFIKLATGLIGTFGTTNLYFLSFLLNQGEDITSKTYSIVMLITLVPVGMVTILATKLSNRFGYQYIIKICGIVYLVSPFILKIQSGIYVFAIFCILFPVSAFSISSIPLLNILWTQFPDNKNKITSVVIFFFVLSGIIWNEIFMMLVNPNNEKAEIQYSGRNYFSSRVTDNLLGAYYKIVFITGICFVVGSFLLKQRKSEKIDSGIRQNSYKTVSDEPDGAEIIDDNNKQNKQVLGNEIQQVISKNQTAVDRFESDAVDHENQSLYDLIFNQKFIYVYLTSLFTCLYFTYTSTNYKLIFINMINDDHFLTYTYMSYAIFSMFGTFIWGHIGDKRGIRETLLIYTVLDVILKPMLFFVQSKISFLIYYSLLGIFDKGILTIVGPGLVQLFGLQNGTELLPIKATSVMIAYGIIPIAQIFTANMFNPLTFLKILGVVNAIAFIPSIMLWRRR